VNVPGERVTDLVVALANVAVSFGPARIMIAVPSVTV